EIARAPAHGGGGEGAFAAGGELPRALPLEGGGLGRGGGRLRTAGRGWAGRRRSVPRHVLRRRASIPTPLPAPLEGEGRSDIALPLDLERRQRTADGHLLAGFAVQGDDLAGDGGGDLDRGLVGHHLGEDLVLGDRVADGDVPADQLGLGGAFAD